MFYKPKLYPRELQVHRSALGPRGLVQRRRQGAEAGAGRAPSAQQPREGAPRLKGCGRWLYTAWDFFWLFMETSSIHGFNHLTTRGRHACEYVFWLAVMVAALGGALSIGLSTWSRYKLHPVVLSMDRDADSFSTPAAGCTFCPTQQFDKGKMAKLLREHAKDPQFSMFILTLFNATYKSLYNFTQLASNFEDFLVPSDYQNYTFTLRNKQRFLVTNSFDTQLPRPIPPNVTTVRTEMGNCFTYNSAVATYMSPLYWSGEITPPENPHLIYGYRIEESMFSKIQVGFSNVYFHGNEEFPDAATPAYTINTPTYIHYYMDPLAIVTTEAVQNLAIEQRNCRFPYESNLLLSPVYAYGICRMECRMRLAYSLCRCVPFFYKRVGNYKLCGVEGMKCLDSYKVQLVRLLDSDGKKLNCKCLPVCDSSHYIVYKGDSIRWGLGSQLQYHILQFPRMRIKRDIIFGFTDVLVSVGGTAGFFLGSSILSFVEIIYFFTLRLFWYIVEKVKGSKRK